MSNEIIPSLHDIEQEKKRLIIQEQVALEKAFSSSDVELIMKAQTYVDKNLKQKREVDMKSIIVDPMELNNTFGYKDKAISVSYDMLRGMSRTHIIKSIIETRKEQVSNFCQPQINKAQPGFIIQKKQTYFEKLEGQKANITDDDKNNIQYLIDFILNCGSSGNSWSGDDFDTFIRKIVQDSLSLDQATFEVVRNRGGVPIEFMATDAATFRLADSYMEDNPRDTKLIKGYAPSYVQLYQSRILNEFYPWELCFGIRNPSSSIFSNGYGRSELEDMIQTVTSILNADSYNANFFKVGSNPKGILKYSGNINQNTIEDFRRQWTAQVSGVANMHKIPLINADKMDFIPTHVPNKDMEFGKYHDFLIKISCAMYKIDPSEVGFPMEGSSGGSAMFNSNNTEEKIKYSKDKGLIPLLRKIEKWLNKFVIGQIDDRYELVFVGLEEDEEDRDIKRAIDEVGSYKTLNEVRADRGLEPIEGGDSPLNPTFLQLKGMEQMNSMEGEEGYEDEGPYEDEGMEFEEEENPFMKSLQSEIEVLLSK